MSRVFAVGLVIVIVVGSAACERAPQQRVASQQPAVAVVANVPVDAAPATSPPDAADSDLPSWLPRPLPRHGFIVGVFGMLGNTQVVVDYDALTLRYVEQVHERGHHNADRTSRITSRQLDELRALAAAAQHEQPHGEMPEITDVSEQLYAFDGDDHVEISGTLFDASELGGPPWRRLAGQLLQHTLELAESLAK